MELRKLELYSTNFQYRIFTHTLCTVIVIVLCLFAFIYSVHLTVFVFSVFLLDDILR